MLAVTSAAVSFMRVASADEWTLGGARRARFFRLILESLFKGELESFESTVDSLEDCCTIPPGW